MRVTAGAISPDEVLAWTGERELTRFDRAGGRWSFTVPLSPVASQIGDALWLVDESGTVHRYDLAGRREDAVVPREPVEQPLVSASLSGDASRLAFVVDDEARVLEHGVAIDWDFERSIALDGGYRELEIELSRDGDRALVEYATSWGWSESAAVTTGMMGDGFKVVDRKDTLHLDDFDNHLRYRDLDFAFAPDGTWLGCASSAVALYLVRATPDARELRPRHIGPVQSMVFASAGRYFGALFHAPQLAIVDVDRRAEAHLELPEPGFRDLVFVGDRDVVLIHPELGTWWIPIASLDFAAISPT